MRRRKGRSGTHRTSSFRESTFQRIEARRAARADRITRRNTTRSLREPDQALAARRGDRRVHRRPIGRRTLIGAGVAGDGMPTGHRQRRANLQSQRKPRSGLSPASLSLRRTDAPASRVETTRSVCTRKKEARRAVIIATGYGGINNQTNYRKRKSCP